jgi:hypothetical protein
MATDEFTNYYTDLLDGSYDCVDRFVSNASCAKQIRTSGSESSREDGCCTR